MGPPGQRGSRRGGEVWEWIRPITAKWGAPDHGRKWGAGSTTGTPKPGQLAMALFFHYSRSLPNLMKKSNQYKQCESW